MQQTRSYSASITPDPLIKSESDLVTDPPGDAICDEYLPLPLNGAYISLVTLTGTFLCFLRKMLFSLGIIPAVGSLTARRFSSSRSRLVGERWNGSSLCPGSDLGRRGEIREPDAGPLSEHSARMDFDDEEGGPVSDLGRTPTGALGVRRGTLSGSPSGTSWSSGSRLVAFPLTTSFFPSQRREADSLSRIAGVIWATGVECDPREAASRRATGRAGVSGSCWSCRERRLVEDDSWVASSSGCREDLAKGWKGFGCCFGASSIDGRRTDEEVESAVDFAPIRSRGPNACWPRG